MINFKNITDVPVVEELVEGSSLLINDNGQAKQIAADNFVPKKSGSSGADIEANVCVAVEKEWYPDFENYIFDLDFLEGSTIAVNGTYAELKEKVKNFGNISIQGGFRYARKDVNDQIMYYPFTMDINKIFGGVTTLINPDAIIDFEYLSELEMTREEFDALDEDEHLEFPYLEEPTITMTPQDWIYSFSLSIIPDPIHNYELDFEDFANLDGNTPLFIVLEPSSEDNLSRSYTLPTTKAKFLSNIGATEAEFIDENNRWNEQYTYTVSNSVTKKELIDSLKEWFVACTGFEECIELYDIEGIYGDNIYVSILGGDCGESFPIALYIFPDPDDEDGIILKIGIPIDAFVFWGW